MGRLTGQVGIVTGAGRGVGQAVSTALAADGMALALVARTAGQVQQTAALVDGYGVGALPFAADVRDPAAIERLVAHTEQRLGPVDLLVNNAGRAEAADVPLWRADLDEVWAVVETNLRGPLLLSAAVLPAMVGRRHGRIVNMNSLAGARPSPVQTGYAMSKGALYRLTDCLAAGLRGTGVFVFDLSPGLVRTDMTRDRPMWREVPESDWTPVERGAAVVAELATGRFDALTGRLLHASEDLDDLLAKADLVVRADARTLRLEPYGADDPLFAD